MGFRFATWPQFNGRRVVLDDDERLTAAVPTHVVTDGKWTVAADTQAVAALSIKNDGTMVLNGTLVML